MAIGTNYLNKPLGPFVKPSWSPAVMPTQVCPIDLPQESFRLSAAPAPMPTATLETDPPPVKAPELVVPKKIAAAPSPATLFMEAPTPEITAEKSGQSAVARCLVQHFESKLLENPKAQAALQKWTPEQRSQLDSLISHPSMEESFAHTGRHTPANSIALLPELIASGRLLDTDKKGKTTLDHLGELQNQPLDENLKKGVVVSELLANIHQPGEINQRDRGTCTVTTIEYFHASQQPSDYARLVKELVHDDGKAHFQTGKVCWVNPTGVKEDSSGRSSVDRIYQSSMMQAAYDGRALYNNLNDSFWTIGWTRQWRDSGLSHEHSGELMAKALGTPTQVMEYEGNQKRFEADIKRAHSLGQNVFVAMRWSPDADDKHANHALSIEKIEGDKVYLRNPWGDGETGGDSGPPRELIGEKGEVVMSKEDFFARLNGAIRPQRNFFNVWANRIRYHFGGDEAIKKG